MKVITNSSKFYKEHLWVFLFIDIIYVATVYSINHILIECGDDEEVYQVVISYFVLMFSTRLAFEEYTCLLKAHKAEHVVVAILYAFSAFIMTLNIAVEQEGSDDTPPEGSFGKCKSVEDYNIAFAVTFFATRILVAVMFTLGILRSHPPVADPAIAINQPLLVNNDSTSTSDQSASSYRYQMLVFFLPMFGPKLLSALAMFLGYMVFFIKGYNGAWAVWFLTLLAAIEIWAELSIFPLLRLMVKWFPSLATKLKRNIVGGDELHFLQERLILMFMLVLGETMLGLLVNGPNKDEARKTYTYLSLSFLVIMAIGIQYFDPFSGMPRYENSLHPLNIRVLKPIYVWGNALLGVFMLIASNGIIELYRIVSELPDPTESHGGADSSGDRESGHRFLSSSGGDDDGDDSEYARSRIAVGLAFTLLQIWLLNLLDRPYYIKQIDYFFPGSLAFCRTLRTFNVVDSPIAEIAFSTRDSLSVASEMRMSEFCAEENPCHRDAPSGPAQPQNGAVGQQGHSSGPVGAQEPPSAALLAASDAHTSDPPQGGSTGLPPHSLSPAADASAGVGVGAAQSRGDGRSPEVVERKKSSPVCADSSAINTSTPSTAASYPAAIKSNSVGNGAGLGHGTGAGPGPATAATTRAARDSQQSYYYSMRTSLGELASTTPEEAWCFVWLTLLKATCATLVFCAQWLDISNDNFMIPLLVLISVPPALELVVHTLRRWGYWSKVEATPGVVSRHSKHVVTAAGLSSLAH